MAKTLDKVVEIRLSDIIARMDDNYREHTSDRYKLPAMMEDIELRGQMEPITVEKKLDNKFYPLKGFRRTFAVIELAKLGKINPDTGKVFDSMKAIVVENLTAQERVKIKLDHGQRESLNKVELFYAICDAFKAGLNEREVAIMSRSLLDLYYPPTRKITDPAEDNGQDLLNHYRGVLQTAKKAWQSPKVVTEAWIKKLQGDAPWPKNSELNDLHKTFTEEAENPASQNKFNRDNPGPKFVEHWNRLVANLQEAQATGKKVKNDSMMNRNQIDEVKKNTDSRILKTFNDILTRKLPQDKLPVLDKVCVELEKLMANSPEIQALFDSMFVNIETGETKSEVAA